MPEPKRPLKVFLCHAHADRDPVRGLYTRLTQDGVDAWFDKAKLLPGQDWELEIRKAVREADVVVVCLSKQFNQDGFRQKEVRLALDVAMEKREDTIFIIPARLEECDNLESLRKWHWVDLFEDDGYEILMRALRARADRIGATLQIKKSWLLTGNTQSAVVKKPSPPVEKPKKEIQPSKKFSKTIIGVIGFSVLVLVLVFSLLPLVGEPEPTPTASNIESLETFTPIPASKTPRVSVTQIAPTVIPTLGIGSTLISGKDQMTLMYVPEGEFIMGVTESNIQQILDDCWSFYSCEITENAGSYEGVQSFSKNSKYWFTWFGLSEQTPSKKVFLDGFWMDKTEVTNSMYLLCVDDGGCDKPTPRVDRESNFGNSEFANYPVENVTWSNADTYCKWAGRRLPTEAEWEKAARSDDGRLFPWGNNRIECANYDGDVLSCPELSSPYGVLNMANFIREWTADWYMPSYYSEVILANPPGPDTGKYKVLRGASDLVNDHQPSMDYGVYRSVKSPSDNDYTGFRCARDANP